MLLIAPIPCPRKGGEGGEYEEFEGNADYGGMGQPSQQHVAPCLKGV